MNKTILMGLLVSSAFVAGIFASSEIVFGNVNKTDVRPVAVESSGFDIQITCPDNSEHDAQGFFFTDTSGDSFSFGDFSETGVIDPDTGSPRMINFRHTVGKIDLDSFVLRGIINQDTICLSEIPIVMDMSGECGLDSTLIFETDSGITGTSTNANIACA